MSGRGREGEPGGPASLRQMLGQELRENGSTASGCGGVLPDALDQFNRAEVGWGEPQRKEEMEVLGEAYSFNKLWDVMEGR